MRFLIIIVVIFSINVDRQWFDLNHAFSLGRPEENLSRKPVLFAVLLMGEVLKPNIGECKFFALLLCLLVGLFEESMGDEVEICDDSVVVSQADHFHAAEGSKFEEDLPLLLGWTVDYGVLNSQKMAELVVQETRTLLFALESQLEAVCALLVEQLGCDLADLSIY